MSTTTVECHQNRITFSLVAKCHSPLVGRRKNVHFLKLDARQRPFREHQFRLLIVILGGPKVCKTGIMAKQIFNLQTFSPT